MDAACGGAVDGEKDAVVVVSRNLRSLFLKMGGPPMSTGLTMSPWEGIGTSRPSALMTSSVVQRAALIFWQRGVIKNNE